MIIHDILWGFIVAYGIMFPTLFVCYICEDFPNTFAKVLFWPIWFMTELILGCKRWYKEFIEEYKHI